MPDLDIAHQRLHNQQINQPCFERPEEVVRWLGAVQAQEYAPTLWSLGLRMTKATEAAVEQAVVDGRILRTHLLRPTWHFVTGEDIRWVLGLTAPHVHALNAYMYRSLELDDALLGRSNDVIGKTLEGGKQLTRVELGAALAEVGIVAEGLRLGYIVHYAELEVLICSGARRGKQFTYALLDERAPQVKPLNRDEALAELVKRYFTSHGPATLKDFTWWSSLTLADAKAGVEMVGSQLMSEIVGGQTLWFAPSSAGAAVAVQAGGHSAHLLPIYDEYISYADRSAIFDAQYTGLYDPQQNLSYSHMIVIDGQVLGTWKRTFKQGAVVIQHKPFRPWTSAEEEAVVAAAHRFGEFLGMAVVMA